MGAKATGRPLDVEIMDAWKQAAQDLGIRVEIPFTLKTEKGNVEFHEGHVLDCGGPKGTVFGTIDVGKNTTKSRLTGLEMFHKNNALAQDSSKRLLFLQSTAER
jgi:hypothetical protein